MTAANLSLKLSGCMVVLCTLVIIGSCNSTTADLSAAEVAAASAALAEAEREISKFGKPVAIPGATPREGGLPLQVHYVDDGSYDSDGMIVKWEWNFGDPKPAAGAWLDYTATLGDAWYTHTKKGMQVAHLRVTDNSGRKSVRLIKVRTDPGLNADPIANAQAEPLTGHAPLTVAFSAVGSYDPDGSIVEWEWDFGTGEGYEDHAETEGNASYTYTEPGEYAATLRVTDDDGAVAESSLVITVLAPPPPAIPESVSASDGDYTDRVEVSWLAAAGAEGYNIYRDELNEPVATIGLETTYNDYDAQAGVEHTYWITSFHAYGESEFSLPDSGYRAQSGAGEWVVTTIDSRFQVGNYPSWQLVDGRPAVAYLYPLEGSLMYAQASVAQPRSDADWQLHQVTPFGPVYYANMAIVNGKPAIAYYTIGTGNLHFAQATTPTPSSPDDWLISVIETIGNTGRYPAIAEVDGLPAVVFQHANSRDVRYARALVAEPSWEGDWQVHTLASEGYVGDFGLALMEHLGRPVVAYYNNTLGDMMYAAASTAQPSSSGDWLEHAVESAGDAGRWPSLAVVNGQPAVAYLDFGLAGLKFAQALVPDPQTQADWLVQQVDAEAHLGFPRPALAVIGGVPVMGYLDDSLRELKFAEGHNAFPQHGGQWEIGVVDAETSGYYAWIGELFGSPGIAYRGGNNLRFAWRE